MILGFLESSLRVENSENPRVVVLPLEIEEEPVLLRGSYYMILQDTSCSDVDSLRTPL